jgi:excisionase family DNA binding protein
MALKSMKQAADTWGVSVYTVRRLAAVGFVRTVSVGRRRLISEDEIARIAATGAPCAAWLEERRFLNRNRKEG